MNADLALALELLLLENGMILRRMEEVRQVSGLHSPSDERYLEYLKGQRAAYEAMLRTVREETDRTPDVRESTPAVAPPAKDNCLSDASRRDTGFELA